MIHAVPTNAPSFDTATATLDRYADVPATGTVGADGTVRHNIDLSHYTGDARAAAESLIEEFVGTIGDFEQKAEIARSQGNEELAQVFDAAAKTLRDAFTELKSQLESGTFNPIVVGAAVAHAGLGALVDGLEVAASRSDVSMELPDIFVGRPQSTCTAAPDSAAAASPAESTTSGALPTDVDELVALFESDPQAFFAKLREMSSEERGAVLMMVQNEIQQTNQLFSMLSNFQNAIHDTQKALLANLRV